MSILLLTMGPQLSVMRVPTNIAIGNAGAVTFHAIGAVGPVTWTLLHSDLPGEWAGALTPAGNEASIIAGNVTTAGTYSVTVRAVDNSRQPVIYTTQVVVMALPITISGVLSQWTEGKAVTDTLTISGGTGTYVSLSIIDGALPTGVGVSLSGSTIVFSGTPTTESDGFVKFQVLDDISTAGVGSFSWDVAKPAGDPYWDNVVSLLHFDGDLTDEAGESWSIYLAGFIDDNISKFGSGSLSTSARGGAVGGVEKVDTSDSFTLEGWVYITDQLPLSFIYTSRHIGANQNACTLLYSGSSNLVFQIFGTTGVIQQFFGGPITSEAWTHIAVTYDKSSNTLRLFQNGVKTCEEMVTTFWTATHPRYLVAWTNTDQPSRYLRGNLDEWRETKGVCRYTANFTPPTSPFPNYGDS